MAGGAPHAFVPPLGVAPLRVAQDASIRRTAFLADAPVHRVERYRSAAYHDAGAANARPSRMSASPKPPVPVPVPSSTTTASDDNKTYLRQLYRKAPIPAQAIRSAEQIFGPGAVEIVAYELCFNIELSEPLPKEGERILRWLLSETFEPDLLATTSPLKWDKHSLTVELGPRRNFQTAWSSNAVSICHACGLKFVTRLERSRRYRVEPRNDSRVLFDQKLAFKFVNSIHDRMTEYAYPEPLKSFSSGLTPKPTFSIPVLEHGRAALEEANKTEGLGFDDHDIDLYLSLFRDEMKRDPTNVELFDLAQSNSEHSRHWFFKGRLVIDGEEWPQHLFSIVKDTLRANPRNSVIAFADNSSTIRGGECMVLVPGKPGQPGPMVVEPRDRDILFTAETHNFPSGVAPFPGAETGTGGRIRDTAATGIGSLVIGGTAGYSVGNLGLEDARHEWEDDAFLYPGNLASPLQILIEASNGASDYGNKFGEPVINGYTRTYGLRLPDGERREYVKPIMFSGGMGQMDHAHSKKGNAENGLWVVKIGGPAYRIGMGGGAASSMMQGDNRTDLDFNAVQRGDAEMEQKAYRVLRACVEMGDDNPIVSIHDQGAGGNCNVVKELIYPAGARIDIRNVWIGDASLSVVEIWGAEYQEQFGLLLRPEHVDMFVGLCSRESVVPAFLGQIDGSGRIVLWDEETSSAAVDLDLEKVLGDLPQKTFVDTRVLPKLVLTDLRAAAQDIPDALNRVLSLMTVGSKRFLTTKVDRSVTGLVAGQQCVGPLHVPLADAAILARSHFDVVGSATAIGERPSLTTLSPQAMARMSVGEMLTNLASVRITAREDIKCEANWMWAAKLPGDGATIADAAVAMRDFMIELGIAVDGGKDSLSMAAKCPLPRNAGVELVRAPGTLVVSGYSTVENVTQKLTPDLKRAGNSRLLHVDIAEGKRRVGGSCLAQVYKQVGRVSPDVDDPKRLAAAFDTVQGLIEDVGRCGNNAVLAYHDISDGGMMVAVVEMALAGNVGFELDLKIDGTDREDIVRELFAEELGMLLEVPVDDSTAKAAFEAAGLVVREIGMTKADKSVTVQVGGVPVISSDIRDLRDTWEKTSFAIERRQANPSCVEAEQSGLHGLIGPQYVVPWTPRVTPTAAGKPKHKVAIVREEGSNGDREMSAAFHMAGFEAWDVSIKDIASGRCQLNDFRGAAFVGGFSYADVMDSAKGWAGVIKFDARVRDEFDKFFARTDTFSLGVCNGCQLMALLGRIPFSPSELDGEAQPRFVHNESGRYESRFSTVRIAEDTPSIMLRGMGGAQLGVWCAHGEGRAHFPDPEVLKLVVSSGLAPVRYIDESAETTTVYPFNPNGSAEGIAGMCSSDGRHLAMMPHPERTVLKWQWPYMPADLDERLEASPWITMFQNARQWCDGE